MRKNFWRSVVVAFSALVLVVPAQAAPTVDKSDNITQVSSFPYPATDRPNMDVGGTDLAFSGPFIYAAEQGREGTGGGLHIFKTAADGRVRKISFLRCGGWQNDVAVVRPGLVALGYHKGKINCGSKTGGVTLIDVKNPERPRILGSTPEDDFDSTENLGGVHTITSLPGTDYVYASPGGAFTQDAALATVIDVSDPRNPKVAGRIENGVGCHDLTFWEGTDRVLGFCTGVGATQIWDMADPLAPSVEATIVNHHYFHHSSAVTSDGSLLVIGTETLGNDCMGGPTGALIAYDISDPSLPVLKGTFGAPRGSSRIYNGLFDPNFETLCAPHLFNFDPGSRTLVSGNGSGGVSVVDFTDPAAPKETAHYMSSDMPMVFSAYWHEGNIYANGLRSFDVFKVKL